MTQLFQVLNLDLVVEGVGLVVVVDQVNGVEMEELVDRPYVYLPRILSWMVLFW